MTGIEIIVCAFLALVGPILEWATRVETRHFFRARRRLRAMKRRKKNPVLEEQRLLQLEHWQKVANDARERMLWCQKEGFLYAKTQAQIDHQHAQNRIKELAK